MALVSSAWRERKKEGLKHQSKKLQFQSEYSLEIFSFYVLRISNKTFMDSFVQVVPTFVKLLSHLGKRVANFQFSVYFRGVWLTMPKNQCVMTQNLNENQLHL